ncbi:MAG: sugar transferase [Bacteroidota bacterium]
MAKRIFDILLTLILLPFLIPVVLVFAIILTVELQSFPFIVQERGITLKKFRFKIIKLRTIKENKNIKRYYIASVFYKPQYIDDVPKFAGWLRRTGLDELPQIYNILKGEMSFVGPRPLMISDLTLLKTYDWKYYKIRASFDSKPGITGLWQIFCNREEGAKNLIALEKIYDEMKSVSYDLKILLYTVPVVLTANNADSIFSSTSFPFLQKSFVSSSTDLEITFAKSNKKITDSLDDYQISLPGNWWTTDESVEIANRKKNRFELLLVKPSTQKTA